jgi:hypothetical protein
MLPKRIVIEGKTERIIRLLSIHPSKRWTQRELARHADVSLGLVNKVVKWLMLEGILARASYYQRFYVLNLSKLLLNWAAQRKLPRVRSYSLAATPEEVEGVLRGRGGYLMTLFRAAWHRVPHYRSAGVELYAKPEVVQAITQRFPRGKGATLIVYSYDCFLVEGIEKIDGLNLVPAVQNYVDLIAFGGVGADVAKKLARKYKLGV